MNGWGMSTPDPPSIKHMKEVNKKLTSGSLWDGRYKLLRPLSSEGGTADVWLAVDTNTIDEVYDEESDVISTEEESGIQVAIKIYRPKNALDLGEQRFREEFKIVFNCHHSNLVQPINFSVYEGTPYLVLPYCKNGSSERLEGKINESDELWRYIADVSAGLAYLHSFNPTIVHHDIKPANVLIDDNNNYAITDFGISAHRGFNREGYDTTNSGTMAYMAPERFREDYESIPESDIWSFGATLYEIVTGKVPFGEEGGLNQLETGAKCPSISQPIPSDIKKFIIDCLSPDPAKRPTASQINQAAIAKCYPVKERSKRWFYIGGAGILAIIGVLLALLLPKGYEQGVPDVPQVSNEEKFAKAMVLVNTADKASLQNGLSILDSLGSMGFIPALYEQAYTYGWYSDSASLERKKLIGIDFYEPGSPLAYIPKENQINIKAIGLFTKIEEIGDPEYPKINANALYRLAIYYANENNIFQTDIKKAHNLLVRALEWADKTNDIELQEKIKRNIEILNQ